MSADHGPNSHSHLARWVLGSHFKDEEVKAIDGKGGETQFPIPQRWVRLTGGLRVENHGAVLEDKTVLTFLPCLSMHISCEKALKDVSVILMKQLYIQNTRRKNKPQKM